MTKRFKFAVVVPNDMFSRIECIDREEAHYEVKRLLDRNPDTVWAIEELDDSEGPFRVHSSSGMTIKLRRL